MFCGTILIDEDRLMDCFILVISFLATILLFPSVSVSEFTGPASGRSVIFCILVFMEEVRDPGLKSD